MLLKVRVTIQLAARERKDSSQQAKGGEACQHRINAESVGNQVACKLGDLEYSQHFAGRQHRNSEAG